MIDSLANATADQLQAAATEALEQIQKALKQEQMARVARLERLGYEFLAEFTQAKTQRQAQERQWGKDLRQYKGLYDPDVAQRLQQKKRSSIFVRMTRAKCKAWAARLGDMLFPAGDKNWQIQATPVPQMPQSAIEQAAASLFAATQAAPTELELMSELAKIAKASAAKMSQVIDDQLTEGQYEREARKVILSAAIFGVGILKGPLSAAKPMRSWSANEDGWQAQSAAVDVAHFSAIPVWSYYPDPSATDLASARYEFEERDVSRSALSDLIDAPGFLGEVIRGILEAHPNGEGLVRQTWQADLQAMDRGDSSKPEPGGMFRVLERWGWVKGEALNAAFFADGAPQQFDDEREYESQCWLVCGKVVRLDVSPFAQQARPFKLFHFDSDETSIWGEGIPSVMRDCQVGANTSLRAAADNAAMTSIPNLIVAVDSLAEEGDTDNFEPGRIWRQKGQGRELDQPAVRVVEIPARVGDFITLHQKFIELADEVTGVPRFSYGAGDRAGITKTVGRLSMLMGHSNIAYKDHVSSWDESITTPFIGQLYERNMASHPDPQIKGDYKVVARGASSLVAKELRSNALQSFIGVILQGAPELANRRELYAEVARTLDLDPDVYLKSEADADQENQEKQMTAAIQEAIAKIAQAVNIDPQTLVQNTDQVIASFKGVKA